MPKRNRSDTSNTSQTGKRHKSSVESSTANVSQQNVDATTSYVEKDFIVQKEVESSTATVDQCEDDIDYDDGDFEIRPQEAAGTTEPADSKEVANGEAQEEYEQADTITPELRLEQGKFAMAYYMQTILSNMPELAAAMQVTEIGDETTVEVLANSCRYEAIWKMVGTYDPEEEAAKAQIDQNVEQPTDDTAETTKASGETPAVARCKFGRNCTKGAACPYDHSAKTKPCQWVNTPQGCTRGDNCEFSHETKGVDCKRSILRRTCPNGRGCTYMHKDDTGLLAVIGNDQHREKSSGPKQDSGHGHRGGKRHRGRGGGHNGRGGGRGGGRGHGRGKGRGKGMKIRGVAVL